MSKAIVSLSMAVVLTGCASQPAPEAMTATAPTPAVSATVVPDATAAAKPASSVPAGYKVRIRKGETYYCKTIEATGSHFPQEACFTRAQLDQQKAANERLLNRRAGCKVEGCVTSQ